METVHRGKRGLRLEYALTAKGRELHPVSIAFAQWGDRWVSGERNEPFVLSNAETDTPLAQIEISDVNGVLVEPGHFRVVPGADAATAKRARSERSDAWSADSGHRDQPIRLIVIT
jgi:hypothetical protein